MCQPCCFAGPSLLLWEGGGGVFLVVIRFYPREGERERERERERGSSCQKVPPPPSSSRHLYVITMVITRSATQIYRTSLSIFQPLSLLVFLGFSAQICLFHRNQKKLHCSKSFAVSKDYFTKREIKRAEMFFLCVILNLICLSPSFQRGCEAPRPMLATSAMPPRYQ